MSTEVNNMSSTQREEIIKCHCALVSHSVQIETVINCRIDVAVFPDLPVARAACKIKDKSFARVKAVIQKFEMKSCPIRERRDVGIGWENADVFKSPGRLKITFFVKDK